MGLRAERRGRGDGGATGAEYALVLALVLAVGAGGAKFLTSRANSQVSNQADCVSTRPPPASCQVAAITTSSTGSSVSTTSSTTLPSTTTTPPVADAAATVTKGSVSIAGTNYATLTITITLTRNPGGTGVTGAQPQFKIHLTTPAGPRDDYVSCSNPTDSTGKCNVTYQVPFSDAQSATVTVQNLRAPIGSGTVNITPSSNPTFTLP